MYQLEIDGKNVGIPEESFLGLVKWAKIAISAGAQVVNIWWIMGSQAHISETYTGDFKCKTPLTIGN